MIVSHRHGFLFIKTRKTGGTSVELALSEICGPEDVVTPVSRPDERLRRGRGPQNYLRPWRERPWDWPLRLLRARNRPDPALMRFWPHMSATQVREALGAEIFDRYLKVTIERNPWDRELSGYHWAMRNAGPGRPSFEEHVLDPSGRHAFHNFEKYSIAGRIVADVVLRHDRLEDDFVALMARLGIDPPPALPAAKSGIRSADSRDYRRHHTPATRAAVAERYRREIEAFGFEF
ncbi:sulfotransferase family 2 domain-containing protein [Prosthecomicrobium sp. N25]|uniref:sulfotransferase family 2 domain-containing protein n=1 Tax=Prosthecomicrobium sp. N25 TaxID=3129254 RepID=UPI003076FE5E